MSDWRNETFDRWVDLIQADGPDFEDIALESLRLATWMVEAALELPEWGRGFVAMATDDQTPPDELRKHVMQLATMFPVEVTA